MGENSERARPTPWTEEYILSPHMGEPISPHTEKSILSPHIMHIGPHIIMHQGLASSFFNVLLSTIFFAKGQYRSRYAVQLFR